MYIVPELTSKQNTENRGLKAGAASGSWASKRFLAGHTPPFWPSSLCVGHTCCWVSAPLCTVVGNCNLTWVGNFCYFCSCSPHPHHCWKVSSSHWHGVFKAFPQVFIFTKCGPTGKLFESSIPGWFCWFSFCLYYFKIRKLRWLWSWMNRAWAGRFLVLKIKGGILKKYKT